MTSNETSTDGAELLDEVHQALLKYVVFPDQHAPVAITLWIAASHGVPVWDTAARLVFKGPQKRCGKTRALEITSTLSHRALITANASAAAVYHSIGANKDDPPTIFIDEADTIFGPKAPDNEDLRGALNAGHQRGRPTIRYDASTKKVVELETFAMAALAGIGNMPDTIEDRAVIITMRRRATHETVAPYRKKRDEKPLNQLAHRLNKWVRANLNQLQRLEPNMPFEDRAADTWEPLIAVADQAGGDWPKNARTAALKILANAANEEENKEIRLLKDCQTIFTNQTAEFIPTTTLLATLNSDLEAPWATHGPGGLNPRQLALILTQFGIQSTKTRTPNGRVRGYNIHDFADTWTRYLGAPPTTRATRATRATPLKQRPKPGPANPKNPNNPARHPDHQPICLHCAQPHSPHETHQCNAS